MPAIRPLRCLAMAAALVCGAAVAAPPASTSHSFTPVADTTIFADIVGGNPSWDDVSDARGESLWVSTTAGGVLRRALVRFDLGAIPAGAQVLSVSFNLYESRARDGHVVSLHRLTAPWGEGQSDGGSAGVGSTATAGDATWRWRDYQVAEWTQRGGDFMAQASASLQVGAPGQTYTWTSTPGLVADVQGWLADPASNFGWILLGPEVDAQNAKRFDSRQGPLAANWPLLQVQIAPVPEAGTVAMLAAGLLVLLALQRRRSA